MSQQQQGKSNTLAGRVWSCLCGDATRPPTPPPPVSVPLRRMHSTSGRNAHLPGVPAETIAAHRPESSRVSGWWELYDDFAGGSLPSEYENVDLSTKAAAGPNGTRHAAAPRDEPVAGPSGTRHASVSPEAEPARSRTSSVDSIDFFNGKVTSRADARVDKSKGKKKGALQRPARREGAGQWEA